AVDGDTAAMMVTNPNTLGVFEEQIHEVARVLHAKGALLYMDGANMNAISGVARPGDFGVDCMHFNLHKTFAVPHGGGGPGAGPIAVRKQLEPFLPVPRIVRGQGAGGRGQEEKKREESVIPAQAGIQSEGVAYHLDYNHPKSIGRVRSYYGNFLALVRAYTYMTACGRDGIRRNSQHAVLNANYVRAKLKGTYHIQHDRICMHEAIFTDALQAKESDIHAKDIAKRLLDYGIHPMTIYFPLAAVTGGHGSIMIEPTESESKATIDYFIDVMKKVAKEAKDNPQVIKDAPHTAPVRRLDEVKATTQPVLCYTCS
ncbi:MAG: hypothetical protein L6Q71_07490, partial [Planctomycetes bacterium]|nr:hypothetical protein [Planctomycetota bacterium]